MADIFSADYMLFWALVLALLLFFPVRRLIWVLMVRRAARDGAPDTAVQSRLHRRATVTAALLCVVFAFLYSATLFPVAR